MPPRSHVDCRISKEVRGDGRSRKAFPTHISLVDGSRGVLDSAISSTRHNAVAASLPVTLAALPC
jgi:hypothetical protein